MKTTALLAFFIFFLVFAFTATAEVVIDSDGDIMRNGGRYILSPQETNAGGGGIVAGAIRKGDTDLCNLALVQAVGYNGWPTIIASPLRAGFIATSFPLYPSFGYLPPNICSNTSSWLVVRTPSLGEAVWVGDGKEFGEAVVSGWFYIKPYESARRLYKLVFCHGNQKSECGNIGSVQVENESFRRLVLTSGEPMVFKFDKATWFASGLSMVV